MPKTMNLNDLVKSSPELLRRREARAITQLIVVVLGYSLPLIFAAWAGNYIAWAVAWLLSGFVMSGLFSGMHYAAHGTIFHSRSINLVVGRIMATLIAMNFTLYKHFHLEHHRHTNVPGDTEVGGELRSIRHYFFYMLNWDFIGIFLKMQYRALLKREYPYFVASTKEAGRMNFDAIALTIWMTAMGVATLLFPLETLALYLIPLQLAWTFNYLFSLPEHYGCPESTNILKSTRTTVLASKVIQLFYWNSNYHAEHHLIAAAPFHSLPAINRQIASQLHVVETSYLSFHIQLVKRLLQEGYTPAPAPLNRIQSFHYPTRKF
jgi:fatty acid desaturase